MSEWDGTPWGGTAVVPPADNRVIVAKAATGWEQFAYSGAKPVSAVTRSPLRRMAEEQALYWTHPWIRVAERAVTRRVSGLAWHIEDGRDDSEVLDDATDPRLRAVRELLEKPQANLPLKQRQPGIDSWSNLVSITSRHVGLCGMTHWFFDEPNGDGTPNAVLYVNPARMWPVTTSQGQLVGWKLDPTDAYGGGGTEITLEEVLTFYLEPPDWGGMTTGLVHAAWQKAQITTSGDRHYLDSLSSGGRLAGLVTPREGTLSDEQFAIAQRELRNAQESPDSSKLLTILRGPVDYHRTTGTAQEMDLSGYAAMTRSDILSIWGVPDTQEGIPGAGGLNSGETRKYDEAVLYQGAVHERVRVIRDTTQFGLLDRFEATGISPQLVIEEPTFDDRAPSFELASKAKDQPLTRNERRDLLGMDPLPEYGPDGEPLGLAIDLPAQIVTIAQGEESERPQPPGRFGRAPKVEPEPLPPIVTEVPQIPASFEAKASTLNRAAITKRFEPIIRKAVASVLAKQQADIAAKVADKGAHLAAKPGDRTWWNAGYWDKTLLDAIKRGVLGLGGTVVSQINVPAKADPFTDAVMQALLVSVAKRVKGINQTTRDLLAAIIADGFAEGLAPAEVASRITTATGFDAVRAELIARTETAQVYNEAALRSYTELGVSQVEAIDGDEDEECAARNGQVFSVEEAMSIEDHPNGTLDWVPIYGGA